MGKMAADFGRSFELAVKRKYDKAELETIKDLTRLTYEAIFRMWPTYTFYSQANHRISISGRRITLVQPSFRPKNSKGPVQGALADKAQAVMSTELAKLDQMQELRKSNKKGGRKVVIGNAVFYADTLGQGPGTGSAIYRRAAEQAVQLLRKPLGG